MDVPKHVAVFLLSHSIAVAVIFSFLWKNYFLNCRLRFEKANRCVILRTCLSIRIQCRVVLPSKPFRPKQSIGSPAENLRHSIQSASKRSNAVSIPFHSSAFLFRIHKFSSSICVLWGSSNNCALFNSRKNRFIILYAEFIFLSWLTVRCNRCCIMLHKSKLDFPTLL